jgi:hypothetical protein
MASIGGSEGAVVSSNVMFGAASGSGSAIFVVSGDGLRRERCD